MEFIPRDELERRASEVLARHGMRALPIDPVRLAKGEGIQVNNAKFSDDGVSGMVARRGDSVSILVNRDDPPFRKRFTIAHELAHHFLHLLQDGDIVDKAVDLFRMQEQEEEENAVKRREIQANMFAAALLMPADDVRRAYEENPSVPHLARLFNVSEAAMAIRLDVLDLE